MLYKILVGPSGSGKSTYAKRLSETENYGVISSDAIRQMVWGNIECQDRTPDIFAIFHRMISMRLAEGRKVIADATHITPRALAASLELAKLYGVEHMTQVVYVERPLSNKLRDRDWRPEWLVRKHDETYEANRQKLAYIFKHYRQVSTETISS